MSFYVFLMNYSFCNTNTDILFFYLYNISYEIYCKDKSIFVYEIQLGVSAFLFRLNPYYEIKTYNGFMCVT